MNQTEFNYVLSRIKENFDFLIQNGFRLDSQYRGTRDIAIFLSSDHCRVTFIEDRGEIFLMIQPIFFDSKEEPLRFEIEVVMALLTNFNKIIRGPDRVPQTIDNQIERLKEIFILHQKEILDLFLPENFLIYKPKLQKAKKEIDKIYINWIKGR